jgi:phage terminase large subunit-like protein
VHHVGMFGALEDQMCTWTPAEKNPDRMDALVWAAHSLMIKSLPKSSARGQVSGLWG